MKRKDQIGRIRRLTALISAAALIGMSASSVYAQPDGEEEFSVYEEADGAEMEDGTDSAEAAETESAPDDFSDEDEAAEDEIYSEEENSEAENSITEDTEELELEEEQQESEEETEEAVFDDGSVGAETVQSQADIEESGPCGEDVLWTFYSDGTIIISGQGAMDDYVSYQQERIWYNKYRKSITKVIIEEGVTHIGNSAFYGCEAITAAEIGNTVTSIGDSAFYNCSKMTTADIPAGVTSIGKYAFFSCDNLIRAEIPGAVGVVGQSLFAFCSNLKTVKLGSGITSIEESAFRFCSSLEQINIPSTVTNIGKEAFYSCKNIGRIDIESVEGFFSLTYAQGDYRINENVEREDGVTLYCNGGLVTEIAIPDGTTTVGNDYKNISSIQSIVIPDSVTEIKYGAFKGCANLKKLTIGKGLELKGKYSMYTSGVDSFMNSWGCSGQIEEIVLSEGRTDIGANALGSEKLKSVTLPSSLKKIEESAFWNATLENLYVSDIDLWLKLSAGSVGSKEGTNLYVGGVPAKDIVIPADITTLREDAFYGFANVESVTMPDSVETVGKNAFQYCKNLKKLTIGAWLELEIPTKGDWDRQGCLTYWGCADYVRTVVLSDGRVLIGDDAFYKATALENVTVPNSVRNIGSGVFLGCNNLKKISLSENITGIGTYVIPSGTTVYCRTGSRVHKYAIENKLKVVKSGTCMGDEWKADSKYYKVDKTYHARKYKCIFCGKTKVVKTKHRFSSKKITKEATFKAKGKMKIYCNDCGTYYKEQSFSWKHGSAGCKKYDITKHSTIYRYSKSITVYLKNPAKGAVVRVKVGKRTFKKKITSSSKKIKVPVKNLPYSSKAKISVYYKKKLIGSDKCYYGDDIVYYSDSVTVGMTQKQVRYTTGKPSRVYESSYGYTTWYYSGGSSVTFKNGRVVRWFFVS